MCERDIVDSGKEKGSESTSKDTGKNVALQALSEFKPKSGSGSSQEPDHMNFGDTGHLFADRNLPSGLQNMGNDFRQFADLLNTANGHASDGNTVSPNDAHHSDKVTTIQAGADTITIEGSAKTTVQVKGDVTTITIDSRSGSGVGSDTGASTPSTNPAQPGSDTGASTPSTNPAQPGSDTGASTPSTNPAQPGSDNGASTPSTNPAQPGSDSGASTPSTNPAQPGSDSGAGNQGTKSGGNPSDTSNLPAGSPAAGSDSTTPKTGTDTQPLTPRTAGDTAPTGGPAQPGQWTTQNINGMNYEVMLPPNYDPNTKYPTLLYLHQLDMGMDPSGLHQEVDGWFNQLESSHPSIIVMPLLDQSADPSGQTINFGGVSSQDNPGETNALAALKQTMSQYSSDPSRVYVTGNSLGGIGSWDMLVKYNAYNGTEGKIFAAGMPLAGNDYGQDANAASQQLKNVPIWAIHGAQDGQVPLNWDQTMANNLSGSSTFHYTELAGQGHDVWDTVYPDGSYWNWLFNQKS